jgi:hypothetical protein
MVYVILTYDGVKPEDPANYGYTKKVAEGLIEPKSVCIEVMKGNNLAHYNGLAKWGAEPKWDQGVKGSYAIEECALLEANYPGVIKYALLDDPEFLTDYSNSLEAGFADLMNSFVADAVMEEYTSLKASHGDAQWPHYFDVVPFNYADEIAGHAGLPMPHHINQGYSKSELEKIVDDLEKQGITFFVHQNISVKSQYCQH